jgi:hypothetical protein
LASNSTILEARSVLMNSVIAAASVTGTLRERATSRFRSCTAKDRASTVASMASGSTDVEAE